MDRANEEMTTEIAIIDESTIRDRIYEVRGYKVMVDFELAEIYGYSTTAFNQQVTNNMKKFEGEDFCFYLTQDEFKELKNLMSKKIDIKLGWTQEATKSLYRVWTLYVDDCATWGPCNSAESCAYTHFPCYERLHHRNSRPGHAT